MRAPDEHRRRLERRQARVEAAAAERRLEVDRARAGEEGEPRAGRAVDALELVDDDVGHARVDEVAVGEQRPELALDPAAAERVREQAELRAQQAHERVPVAAHERDRRAQQREAADPPGLAQPDLDRHAAAHRVADQVRALDLQRVHRPEHGAGEERRAVRAQRGLARAAEARQVERVDAVAAAERRRGVEERGLGGAEAVQQQHVGALAHRQRGDRGRRAPARRRGCAAAAGGRWGGGTGPRSRPRGRGRRGRTAGAARTPRRRRARPGAGAARCRRRCRSRRPARRLVAPGADAGAVRWYSGPPRCARCRPGGRGRWRRSPAPPPGSASGSVRNASCTRPPAPDIGAASYPDGRSGRAKAPAPCGRFACYDTRLRPGASRCEPRDPGKVGIYACGPTVYSRIHVGNARPFVVFSQLKRFLEHEGLEATLVANVTDINDKIYDAARARGRAVGRAGARDDRALHRRHRAARARPARPRAAGLRVRRADRGADRATGRRAATPTRPAATSTSACARCDAYGELSHRDVDQMDQGEGVEGADRKEDPLDFALWKGAEGGRGHVLGRRRGAAGGRAGTSSARRWPRSCWAWSSTSTAAASTSSSRTTRTRRRRRWPRAGSRWRALWMHNGMLQLGRREDVQVGRQHPRARRGARRGRAATRCSCTSSAATTASRSRSRASGSRTRPRGVGADPRGGPAAGAGRVARRTWRRCATRSSTRWPTTSTPRGRWRALFDWIREANRRDGAGRRRAPARDARACSGSTTCSDADEGPPPEAVELAAPARRGARGDSDLAEADRLRDELRAAGWEVRDGPSRPRSSCRVGVIVYGRNAVREALRGRRRCGGSGRVKGGLERRRRSRRPSPAEITARCGSDAHQGVCADVEEYRYADAAELLAAPEPVPGRARRGHRPAEPRRGLPDGRGRRRHRRDHPRAALGRGHARGLQGVGGGGRAPRDRAGAQPRRLPRATPRQAGCWVYGAAAAARTPYDAPDYRGGVVLVLGAEGKGLRPRVGDACDDLVALPAARAHRLAQRQRRRGGSYVRDLAAAA